MMMLGGDFVTQCLWMIVLLLRSGFDCEFLVTLALCKCLHFSYLVSGRQANWGSPQRRIDRHVSTQVA